MRFPNGSQVFAQARFQSIRIDAASDQHDRVDFGDKVVGGSFWKNFRGLHVMLDRLQQKPACRGANDAFDPDKGSAVFVEHCGKPNGKPRPVNLFFTVFGKSENSTGYRYAVGARQGLRRSVPHMLQRSLDPKVGSAKPRMRIEHAQRRHQIGKHGLIGLIDFRHQNAIRGLGLFPGQFFAPQLIQSKAPVGKDNGFVQHDMARQDRIGFYRCNDSRRIRDTRGFQNQMIDGLAGVTASATADIPKDANEFGAPDTARACPANRVKAMRLSKNRVIDGGIREFVDHDMSIPEGSVEYPMAQPGAFSGP